MEENRNNRIRMVIIAIIIIIAIAFVIKNVINEKMEITTNAEKVQETEDEEVDNSDIKTTVDFNKTANFTDDGLLMLSKGDIYYIIDKDFKIIYSVEGSQAELKDGYLKIENGDKTSFYDREGNECFSYTKFEYEEVGFASNGCLIIVKKTDTYNSSTTTKGIYSLEKQKYILEPSAEYDFNMNDIGDGMISFGWTKKCFNTKTEKIVEYSELIAGESFIDGYIVSEVNNGIKVYDENGSITLIENGNSPQRCSWGEGLVLGTNGILYNLETKTYKDLKSQFYSLDNSVESVFNGGYALVRFSNEGLTPYYTVIDREGNMLFEPQKRNNDNNLRDNGASVKVGQQVKDGYFLGEVEGIDTVFDIHNNQILKAEENEQFQDITNYCVRVKYDAPGVATKYYFKDMQGNKIEIRK